MTWEALTAVGTVSSALVITITVVIAARQIRLTTEQVKTTNAQLDHLRRATQLEGVMAFVEKLDDGAYIEAERFVRAELADKMRDESFREELAQGFGARDPVVQQVYVVLKHWEQLGTYVKNGLLDAELIYDLVSPTPTRLWELLRDAVDVSRKRTPTAWRNFERLAQDNRRWMVAHGFSLVGGQPLVA